MLGASTRRTGRVERKTMPSVLEILRKHRVQTAGEEHHHVRHGWIGADCPLCSPSTSSFRLGFHESGTRANCWNCGAKNPADMLARVCRIPYREAAVLLGGLPRSLRRFEAERVSGRLAIPKGVAGMLPAHKKYLRKRGFDPAVIARLWGVQGIGIAARLSWRIWIPIRDRGGRLVSWTTRAIGTDAKRYIMAAPEEEDIPNGELLYGADLARQAIIINEGPLDAWAIGPGAVATCGLAYTAKQILRMGDFPIRAVCFDSTPDAQKRANELCRSLSQFPGTTSNIELESGDDPADADADEIEEIRKEFL